MSFAAAESAKMEVQCRIEQAKERIRADCELFEHEQETGIDSIRYVNFKNYLCQMDRELLLLDSELEKACRDLESRRKEMVEWNKSVELLESIEDREREAYRYETARKDQKKMDEVAVSKEYRERKQPLGRDEE